MARVIGSSMARIAEAETAPGTTPILMGTGDSVVDADAFAEQAGASIPAMARLLEYVWRRHLQAATHRAMLRRTRGSDRGIRPVMAVGFRGHGRLHHVEPAPGGRRAGRRGGPLRGVGPRTPWWPSVAEW